MLRSPSCVGPGDVAEDAVLDQLDRVLRSTPFHSSKKCKRFLRYVVEHMTDAGRDKLNERTLGVKVYGRAPDYDTVQDPVVRTAAVETRKRLALYYLDSRHEHEIRISLPVGQYVPEVMLPTTPEIPADAEEVERIVPLKRGVRSRWVGILAVAGVAAASAILLGGRLRTSPLDRFWAPFVESQNPVLLCVVQPRAFTFDDNLRENLQGWFGKGTAAVAVDRPPESLSLNDLVPQWGDFVVLNHARATTRISRELIRRGQSIEMVGEPSYSFRDARARPTILLGPLSEHRMSSILAGELRFHLDFDPNSRTYVIHDTRAGDTDGWRSTREHADQPFTTEYAVVSRVRSSVTGQPVIVAAGTRSAGTVAAADFISNESYFDQALADAAGDWYGTNMQVVISTKVINEEPGPPEVVATYFW